MTACTVVAEPTFVRIVTSMAAGAAASAQIVVTLRAVTRRTGQVRVSLSETEVRNTEMIEGNTNPVGSDMTTGALVAVLAIMYVVLSMT